MYKKPNEWSQEMFVSFLQRVIIVNSKLYYDTETVKLTDKQYDNLCKQLLTEQSKINIENTDYYNAFYDFDGSTGFNLPQDDRVMAKAQYLLMIRSKRRCQ